MSIGRSNWSHSSKVIVLPGTFVTVDVFTCTNGKVTNNESAKLSPGDLMSTGRSNWSDSSRVSYSRDARYMSRCVNGHYLCTIVVVFPTILTMLGWYNIKRLFHFWAGVKYHVAKLRHTFGNLALLYQNIICTILNHSLVTDHIVVMAVSKQNNTVSK